MNKRLLMPIILVIIFFVFSYFVYSLDSQKNNKINIDPATILFSERSGGFCPPDIVCHQSVDLYYSGKLVMSGKIADERQLDQSTLDRILDLIQSTGIMKKNCSTTEQFVDFSATYSINYNNLKKKIIYPGCQKELEQIKSIINM